MFDIEIFGLSETMMRGNPGFMYVKDATVMAKGRKAESVLGVLGD